MLRSLTAALVTAFFMAGVSPATAHHNRPGLRKMLEPTVCKSHKAYREIIEAWRDLGFPVAALVYKEHEKTGECMSHDAPRAFVLVKLASAVEMVPGMWAFAIWQVRDVETGKLGFVALREPAAAKKPPETK